MKNLPWLISLFLASLVLASSSRAQQAPGITITPLNPGADSEITHDLETGISVATNGVIVTYGSTRLVADTVHLNMQTGSAVAEGNVRLERDALIWRGERLEYNFRSGKIQADRFRLGLGPVFIEGEQFQASTDGTTFSATNSFFTTDDLFDPAYRIRARSLTLIPNDSIKARKTTVYVGDVPVLYSPYLGRTLKSHQNFVVFSPGYRSLYGPYLLGSYHWNSITNLDSAINLDYRQKRGIGLGPDFSYDLGRWGQGSASFYYLNDNEPGLDPDGVPIREERHHLTLAHQAELRENLTAKLVVQKQSDAQFERDFFEDDYRSNPQPESFLEVNQAWRNFDLNLLTKPQLNDFFQTIERLPDLKLSGYRQQLGVSPIYYEEESSVGYLRFNPAENAGLEDYTALRADTFHQLLLPKTLFNWLNITPRVGGRMTHYGETDGFGSTLEEQNRAVFNTGAEVSFKASQLWPGVSSTLWDADGLRHIIQPSVNYAFVPTPNRAPRELPQFDYDIPSLRLLPIDYPDYNSIDSIDSQNVLRLSVHNKLQTKRRGKVDDLAHWALVTDWRLDPRSDQATFSDVYSDLTLKPRSWLRLGSEVRYDSDAGLVRMANHQATLEPSATWAFSLGHRYFREDPNFGVDSENNLIHSSIFYRFNENWAGRVTHHFEGRDGVLEEQYYTVYRDLRSWTSALTFRVRERRSQPTDFTVAVTFSLKAAPRFTLDQERKAHNVLFRN